MFEYFNTFKYVYFTKDVLKTFTEKTEHLKENVEDRFDCY